MLLFIFLGVIGIVQSKAIPEHLIGQTSYEFTSFSTRVFEMSIGPVLRNTIANNMDLHYIVNCSAPVKMQLIKCSDVILESEEPFQNGHYIFGGTWPEYLLKTYMDECDYGPKTQEFFKVYFSAEQLYTCKLIFRMHEKVSSDIAPEKTTVEVSQTKEMAGYPVAFDPSDPSLTTINHSFNKHFVRFYVGKCNFMDPIKINFELEDDDLARIRRWRDLKCALEHHDGFRTYILAYETPLRGYFSFGPRRVNIKKKSSTWLTILCAAMGVAGIIFCGNVIHRSMTSDGIDEQTEMHPVYVDVE